MTPNLADLGSFQWRDLESPEDWVNTLTALLNLAKTETHADRRRLLATKLDEFADEFTGATLSITTQFDVAARNAARGLRNKTIEQAVKDLEASSADYHAAVKEFEAVTRNLKKEASVLRAQSILSAVSSLNETILSLKKLSQTVTDPKDAELGSAIAQAITDAQTLRGILETSK